MYTYLGVTDRACFTFDVADMPDVSNSLPGTIVRTGNNVGVCSYRGDGTFNPAYSGRTLTNGAVTFTGSSVTKLYFCLEDVVVGDADYFYMNAGNSANNDRFQIQLFVVGMYDNQLR